MTESTQLHLVDAEGAYVKPAIREATQLAFHWVSKDFPNLDKAQLADWAEEVAVFMHERENTIDSPERYAYVALKGKVRDWQKLGAAKEETSGVRRDIERIAGSSSSFQGTVDRRIMIEQIRAGLSDRDRDILTLILNEHSSQEVAAKLQINDSAARKAIQRVKQRIGALLGNR